MGLIKNGLFISSFIWITEKKFLEKYVTPFEKDLALVLDSYKAQIDHIDIFYTLSINYAMYGSVLVHSNIDNSSAKHVVFLE
jgi:hypothetical protein